MKADINKYSKFLLSWEGGYSNSKYDSGGPTKYGVTLSTWIKDGYDKNKDGKIDIKDLKQITKTDAIDIILKNGYWNKWHIDEIKDEWVAYLLIDWFWNSGVYGIIIPQNVLGIKADGIVGAETINKINSFDPHKLFNSLWKAREAFFINISKPGTKNNKNRKGWLRRLNSITYGKLLDTKGNIII